MGLSIYVFICRIYVCMYVCIRHSTKVKGVTIVLAEPAEEEEEFSDTESISESFEDIDASAASEGSVHVNNLPCV